MNGFIMRVVTAACLGTGLAALGGCKLYDNFVDPCYPERYNAMSRQAVVTPFATQAANGHVLDQTVWAYFFEPGTDKLTLAGQIYLSHLARKRPHPDPKLWVQTAGVTELPFDQAAPDKLINARHDLDGRRVQVVERFLQAHTADRPIAWEVAIHDPPTAGIHSQPMQTSIMQNYATSMGTLPMQGSGPGMTSGGPTGPAPR